MQSKAKKTRNHILITAKNFILDNSFHSLTLSAVAQNAGISKGGLLYHFPNKEKLIVALGEYIFQEFEKNFNKIAKSDPIKKGKWTRALIKTAKADLTQNAELNVAFFAASILEPETSKNLSETYRTILKKTHDDELSPMLVNTIRLAIDGLYYSQTLNVAPLGKESVNDVIEQLIKMTKDEG